MFSASGAAKTNRNIRLCLPLTGILEQIAEAKSALRHCLIPKASKLEDKAHGKRHRLG